MNSGNTIITLVGYLLYMVTIMYSYRFGWKRFNWYAIISFTLLLGLRGNGIDYDIYDRAFHKLVENNASLFSDNYLNTLKYFGVHFEIGHLVYIKLISLFTHNSIFFFSMLAFIQVFFFDLFVQQFKKKRERFFLAFFFFTTLVFCNVFNGMRQFAAFLMFINGYKFIANRDLKKYIVWVLVVSTIHKSILIMLPFYFFIDKDFLPIRKIQAVMYLVMMFFSNVFSNELRSVLYGLNYATNEGYSGYFQRDVFELDTTLSPFVVLFRLSTFFFLLFYSKRFKERYGRIGVISYNFLFIGCMLQELSFNLAILRMNIYFYYVGFIVMALISYNNLYERKRKLKEKIFTYGMLMLHFAWFANCVLKGASGCAPYILSRYL